MNFWRRTHEKDGKVETTQGPFEPDPFKDLLKDDGLASVGCTYGGARNYGNEKISFMVNVHCDQNEATVNEAGKRVFLKTLEFVEDACGQLGWKPGDGT